MATRTLSALFDNYDDAAAAVRKIEAAGVPHADISIVANNEGDRYSRHTAGHADHHDTADKASSGAGAGASVGTVLGGGAGLLTGLGLLAIPGVGPVVAAGWLVTTLAGAGVGAAAGGILGSLTGAGLSEEEAHSYAEGVRRGGTLVTVRADDAVADRVAAVLKEHGSVDMDERAKGWRSEGWSGRHDPAAPSYSNPASVASGEVGSTAIGAAGSTTTGLNTGAGLPTGGTPYAAGAPPAARALDAATDRDSLAGTTRDRHVGIEDELPPARQPLGTDRR
ncbi:hypothetical protein [Methylobacterium isbiliense]|jgi:hypothetical protein|uniref:General stress protein 17M-like domain-containing protein n=1 Tax=Methylobacterium isbiliense TaxID=315478 RepID=A0ABQ4SCF7_9HYPH|nr:hypothetical protein [Methylobacterium isbiliense]MDN3623299.1 hypothetical protein [Methylobacterium isbiliense]GJE00145.1 hypothetical protein GMJLKIPL_2063 [Methylobacterium isbiliense]